MYIIELIVTEPAPLPSFLHSAIVGKAERQSSKLEKELQDIKVQLNKANKEADSSKKETKRSKGFTFF